MPSPGCLLHNVKPPHRETAPPTTPPTEPPFEMEVLEPFDNPSDTCIITVYTDYFDVAEMGNPILMEQIVQESTFTELALPEAPSFEGYSVSGYVIAYSPSSSNFTNAGWYDEQGKRVYSLLAEDLFTQKQENGEDIDWTRVIGKFAR